MGRSVFNNNAKLEVVTNYKRERNKKGRRYLARTKEEVFFNAKLEVVTISGKLEVVKRGGRSVNSTNGKETKRAEGI